MRKFFGKIVCWIAAVTQEIPGQIYTRIKTWQIKGREMTFPLFSSSAAREKARTKVLIIVTHYAERDPLHASTKAEKLAACLDGVLRSFAHCELSIIINTTPDRHVRDELPPALAATAEWRAEALTNPMYLGFRAIDWMLEQPTQFDYCIYLEDDIVIEDSMFLDKLALFAGAVAQADWLLMPNRYEYHEQRKTYIDSNDVWSGLSAFNLGDYQFSENANPHSGMFALSRDQLGRVAVSRQRLYRRECFTGPRESASTGWLLEHFKVFKPAPPNMQFLEVRHWDNRYSRQLTSNKP